MLPARSCCCPTGASTTCWTARVRRRQRRDVRGAAGDRGRRRRARRRACARRRAAAVGRASAGDGGGHPGAGDGRVGFAAPRCGCATALPVADRGALGPLGRRRRGRRRAACWSSPGRSARRSWRRGCGWCGSWCSTRSRSCCCARRCTSGCSRRPANGRSARRSDAPTAGQTARHTFCGKCGIALRALPNGGRGERADRGSDRRLVARRRPWSARRRGDRVGVSRRSALAAGDRAPGRGSRGAST